VTSRPRDVTDLYLAPVVLGLDHRLDEMSHLSAEEVRYRVILDTDREPRTATERGDALLEALLRGLEVHGWRVSWHDRGLSVAHGTYALVLGVPANLVAYLGD